MKGCDPEGGSHHGGVDQAMYQNFLGKETALFATRHPIVLKHPIADQMAEEKPSKYVHG